MTICVDFFSFLEPQFLTGLGLNKKDFKFLEINKYIKFTKDKKKLHLKHYFLNVYL